MVGRLLTERSFNKQAMINTLKQVWKLVKEFSIIALEENLFLFKFASEADMDRVLEGSPWTFDKHLLLFANYDGNLCPEDYNFTRAPFWIRIYELPLGKRNLEVAEKLGKKMGKLIAVDPSLDMEGWSRFLRVRVEIDVTKPLRRTILLGKPSEGTRGRLAYERLPVFCCYCGLIGHCGVDCEDGEGGNIERTVHYGEWLRASPLKAKLTGTGSRVPRRGENNGNLSPAASQVGSDESRERLAIDCRNHGVNQGNCVASQLEEDIEKEMGRLNSALLAGPKKSKRDTDMEINGPARSKQKLALIDEDSISSFGNNSVAEVDEGGETGNSKNNGVSMGGGNKSNKKAKSSWKRRARITSGVRDASLLNEKISLAIGDGLTRVENQFTAPPRAMIGVSWNCRGLGNPRAVRALRALIRKERPNVLFLMETKLPEHKLDSIRRRCGFIACFGVGAIGRSGGQLATHAEKTWFCFGDFNEILWQEEKDGGRLRPERQLVDFRDALQDCELQDVGFHGHIFTWNGVTRTGKLVKKRLDRGVASMDWLSRFPTACVSHLITSVSDHSPILLKTEVRRHRRKRKPKECKRSYFETSWCKEVDCEQLIVDNWEFSNGMELLARIGHLRDSLRGVYAKKFSVVKERIDEITQALKVVAETDRWGNMRKKEADLREELNRLLEEEETYWMQRSRVNWLSDGDRNTSFFHAQASKRRKKNSIEGLEGDDGQWTNDLADIQEITSNYFKKLFDSSGFLQFDEILEAVNPSITAEMNEHLLTEFTAEEIFTALKQMHPIKAPGPDGKQGSGVFFALKLDMSKAYDRVEWDFLEAIMLRMGFATRWVEMIMRCVRSVSFSVVVNGDVTEEFKPARGLRQGDPLLPYLFLMCTEGLSALLSKGKTDGLLSGVSVSRNGPRVSHLFFADDSPLFGKANSAESEKVRDYLKIYEECSGQKINFDKSVVFFSSNTLQADRDRIREFFGVGEQSIIEKYLGLPTLVGRNKKSTFNWIKERIAKKIGSWNMRWLSQGGREVMIKSVLQSIPTYAMQVFSFPQTLCNEIDGMIARFWWKQQIDKRPIYWVAWSKLCRAKDFGGLGFRNMEWTSFLDAKVGWTPSFTWRSILKGRELLQFGLRWRIGDGRNVRVLRDKWVANLDDFIPHSGNGKIPEDMLVAELMQEDDTCWNRDLIRTIFNEADAEAILQIPLSYRLRHDILVWHFDNKGFYSIKSGYMTLCNLHGDEENEDLETIQDDKRFLRCICNAEVPPKVRVFAWRLFYEILPVMENLYSRHIEVERWCFRCKQEHETIIHAIQHCPFAIEVWNHVSNFFVHDEANQVVDGVRIDLETNSDWFHLNLLTAWAIWGARNMALYDNKVTRPFDTTFFAYSYFKEYARCKKAAAIRQKPDPPRWSPPVSEIVKINFDAAVSAAKKIGAYGVVARNSSALPLGACSGMIPHVVDAYIAESFAAVRALSWAREMGFHRIILEGDALNIIRKINSHESDFSPIGAYVEEARSLKILFQNCSLQHIGKSGNMVAHHLAQHGLSINEKIVWIEDMPLWLHDSLNNDSMVFDKRPISSSSSKKLKSPLPREDTPLIGNKKPLSSQPKTFANVFIAIVGAGVLGLPYAFKRTGWIMGLLMLFSVATLTTYCMMLLVYTRRKLESYDNGFAKIASFGDLGFAVCGSVGRFVVDVLIILSQAGFCVGYLIFIANTLANLFNGETSTKLSLSLGMSSFTAKSLYIWGCFPFQLGLNSIATLTHLAPLSIFADVVDLGAMGVVIVEDVALILKAKHEVVAFGGLSVFLYGMGVAVYAFEGIGMVLPIESETKDTSKFGRVLALSMGSISLIYGAFGVLGYFAFGEDTKDIITANLGAGWCVLRFGVCIASFVSFAGVQGRAGVEGMDFGYRNCDHRPCSWSCRNMVFSNGDFLSEGIRHMPYGVAMKVKL
ncbi:reverse transcriptase [Corchorus capsularis]|uniref:Reverse transcriptase n=1 Tax=Corchorus capsularis TaxID=210143 RepID=A0A1R3JW24_COCAP|nr:reverse transcriptase [Corchorus capsularis]